MAFGRTENRSKYGVEGKYGHEPGRYGHEPFGASGSIGPIRDPEQPFLGTTAGQPLTSGGTAFGGRALSQEEIDQKRAIAGGWRPEGAAQGAPATTQPSAFEFGGQRMEDLLGQFQQATTEDVSGQLKTLAIDQGAKAKTAQMQRAREAGMSPAEVMQIGTQADLETQAATQQADIQARNIAAQRRMEALGGYMGQSGQELAGLGLGMKYGGPVAGGFGAGALMGGALPGGVGAMWPAQQQYMQGQQDIQGAQTGLMGDVGAYYRNMLGQAGTPGTPGSATPTYDPDVLVRAGQKGAEAAGTSPIATGAAIGTGILGPGLGTAVGAGAGWLGRKFGWWG